MTDTSKRVVLKGPALAAALAIQEEMELSNLSDAISVFVDRCNRGQLPATTSPSSASTPPEVTAETLPGPMEF